MNLLEEAKAALVGRHIRRIGERYTWSYECVDIVTSHERVPLKEGEIFVILSHGGGFVFNLVHVGEDYCLGYSFSKNYNTERFGIRDVDLQVCEEGYYVDGVLSKK